MSRFDEFEPDFDHYDECPEEDPFLEEKAEEIEWMARDGDPQDWVGFQVESELAFKDGVTERLLEVIEEYLGFSTKAQLLELIGKNF